MASERITPNTYPNRRIDNQAQASVNRGWSSVCRETVNFNNKSPQVIIRPISFDSENSKGNSEKGSFDICLNETRGGIKLNKSLLELNRERRKGLEAFQNVPKMVYLRSGMMLLKNFLKHHDQVKIVKFCRDLGTGKGGFYTPEYSDGAKLHLKMMCLGMNWDPNSSSYENNRSFDGAIPPKIPEEFTKLVGDAIQASHDFLKINNGGMIDVERELPWMSPDICIVNFYNNSGKLGLHQDKDETRSSLAKGLPVVSFSIGDTAEFLYGEERDVDRVKRVELESGDVLLFGGESRHLFHGVSNVKPNTAPKWLVEETKLRPGRLNLTFRQY